MRVLQVIAAHNRTPVESYNEDGVDVFVFNPPLTAQEQAAFDRFRALSKSAVQITPAEWEALEPIRDAIKVHRQRTDPQWSALTAAQRDQALIEWCRGLTDVLRAMLRD